MWPVSGFHFNPDSLWINSESRFTHLCLSYIYIRLLQLWVSKVKVCLERIQNLLCSLLTKLSFHLSLFSFHFSWINAPLCSNVSISYFFTEYQTSWHNFPFGIHQVFLILNMWSNLRFINLPWGLSLTFSSDQVWVFLFTLQESDHLRFLLSSWMSQIYFISRVLRLLSSSKL